MNPATDITRPSTMQMVVAGFSIDPDQANAFKRIPPINVPMDRINSFFI